MKTNTMIPKLMMAAMMLGLAAAPSQAAVILSVNPPVSIVNAGATGQFFDVVMTIDTPSSIQIASFSFGISATSDVTFTGVLTSPANYVFSGNSLFAPDIRTTGNGSTLAASDITATGLNITLAGNATYSLGRVYFDLAPSAVGPIAVNFDLPSTSLSNDAGGAITINSFLPGEIDVAVPEPGTAALFLLAAPALAFFRRRK